MLILGEGDIKSYLEGGFGNEWNIFIRGGAASKRNSSL